MILFLQVIHRSSPTSPLRGRRSASSVGQRRGRWTATTRAGSMHTALAKAALLVNIWTRCRTRVCPISLRLLSSQPRKHCLDTPRDGVQSCSVEVIGRRRRAHPMQCDTRNTQRVHTSDRPITRPDDNDRSFSSFGWIGHELVDGLHWARGESHDSSQFPLSSASGAECEGSFGSWIFRSIAPSCWTHGHCRQTTPPSAEHGDGRSAQLLGEARRSRVFTESAQGARRTA